MVADFKANCTQVAEMIFLVSGSSLFPGDLPDVTSVYSWVRRRENLWQMVMIKCGEKCMCVQSCPETGIAKKCASLACK